MWDCGGGREGEGEEWWDRVIRLVEGGGEGLWLCVEAEREKADFLFLFFHEVRAGCFDGPLR